MPDFRIVTGKQNDMPECMDQMFFKIDMAFDANKVARLSQWGREYNGKV